MEGQAYEFMLYNGKSKGRAVSVSEPYTSEDTSEDEYATSTCILTKGFVIMLESIAGCETSDLREQKCSGGYSGVRGRDDGKQRLQDACGTRNNRMRCLLAKAWTFSVCCITSVANSETHLL